MQITLKCVITMNIILRLTSRIDENVKKMNFAHFWWKCKLVKHFYNWVTYSEFEHRNAL